MNERIQGLVKQIDPKFGKNQKWAIVGEADIEKFAELIVREICDMMEQAENDAYHCFEPSDRPTEYIQWLNNWQEQFKKHFGIEK